MVDVQFEENYQSGPGGSKPQQIFGVPREPWMIRLLLKLGVRDEKTANYILIGIALLFLGVSAYFFLGSGAETSPEPGDAAAEQPIEPN